MASDLIQDHEHGTEIPGTRITIYNLLPYFLDPSATEEYIGKLYDLTVEQVAAARASVFANAETVLARHLEIESRLSAGNPPEVIERARLTQQRLRTFKEWLAKRQVEDSDVDSSNSNSGGGSNSSRRFPSFREWLSQQETLSVPESQE